MPFQNLFFFLIVIFLLTLDSGGDGSLPTFWPDTVLLILLPAGYALTARNLLSRIPAKASAYFRAEKWLIIFAVALFALCVFGLGLPGYLQFASFGGLLPSMPDVLGLGYFLMLLSLLWLQCRPKYEQIFQHQYTAASFVVSRLRNNIPIVLPWLILGMLLDLLGLLPFPRLQELVNSESGDTFTLIFFVLLLLLVFPPLLRRFWGCTPLPPGEHRSMVEQFCARLGFQSEILLWPLFEGQALTAGVVGIVPKLRYLLLTPALLKALPPAEIKAVLAHEVGHVKKYHMLLYMVLFIGFALFSSALAEPLSSFVLSSNLFFFLLAEFGLEPESIIIILVALPMLAMLLLYFRYIFGYFIRNFERQADLHAFTVQQSAWPMINAFERISMLSGNIKDEPSWHHFSIAQRIAMLRRCEEDPGAVRGHERKLYLSLALYLLLLIAMLTALHFAPTAPDEQAERRYKIILLQQTLAERPHDARMYHALGDLLGSQHREEEALAAYEEALRLGLRSTELQNNLAWLLLTAENVLLRDPKRALKLARLAVKEEEAGFILDTLAVALAANGDPGAAVAAEQRAMVLNPAMREYAQSQIERFRQELP